MDVIGSRRKKNECGLDNENVYSEGISILRYGYVCFLFETKWRHKAAKNCLSFSLHLLQLIGSDYWPDEYPIRKYVPRSSMSKGRKKGFQIFLFVNVERTTH